jgi:hypothetical protein
MQTTSQKWHFVVKALFNLSVALIAALIAA